MSNDPDLPLRQGSKPLITFAIITYNQEKFIQEAVEGAFAQTYSPLEILLSDDCSTDKTYQVMEDLVKQYQGPHHVILNKMEKNTGLAGHVNKVVQMAQGDLIVLAAGDDISMPDRAQASWKLLASNQECTCVSFNTIVFNDSNLRKEPGEQSDPSYKKYSIEELLRNFDFHINGAARTFRKSTFELFGALMPETPTEDSTILLRCILAGAVIKSNQSQVYYRVHGNNVFASGNKYFIDYQKIHSQYMRDLRRAVELGLINTDLYSQLEASLTKKLHRRLSWSKFHRDDKKVGVFISSILFSKYFRPKEKWSYLKQIAGLMNRKGS